MADRCTLHISKLEKFKDYLNDQGIAYRAGKGEYQVLQAKTELGWQVIFKRNDMPEHYSINDKLVGIVREFLNSQKIAN